MNKLIPMLGAAAFMAVPAAAQDEVTIYGDEGLPTAEVFHYDLDLSSSEDVSLLKWRIKSAARDLCISGNVEPMGMKAAQRVCYNHAKNDGLGQLDRLQEARLAGNVIAAKAAIVLRAR
ncbi:UrcA family protein [Sphingomicrobium lutaoense]|uniref:UrcA family protein n=1 Tax=Sphingomicrobium lutaoense TaxID=515949 RepID=A0A839Z5X9_9SPHN|nr:UrcA family protein [Sphingomicrobium lutaoense]MBB3764094.1 UrcA family protein [Sphingomicrobium lutaoense]